ncbi:MAG TPA: cyclic-di-AMP receptor [Thermomicrobiales bacterium]|nr:cyclic-di-AMP receptor [Thermomicrobiales bacterium]
MSADTIDRLVVAVVQRQDVEPLLAALRVRGYGATVLASAGGFLRRASVTLLIAVAAWQVRVVRELLRAHCQTREEYVTPLALTPEGYELEPVLVEVGGAVVFVLPIVRHERLHPPEAPGRR